MKQKLSSYVPYVGLFTLFAILLTGIIKYHKTIGTFIYALGTMFIVTYQQIVSPRIVEVGSIEKLTPNEWHSFEMNKNAVYESQSISVSFSNPNVIKEFQGPYSISLGYENTAMTSSYTQYYTSSKYPNLELLFLSKIITEEGDIYYTKSDYISQDKDRLFLSLSYDDNSVIRNKKVTKIMFKANFPAENITLHWHSTSLLK